MRKYLRCTIKLSLYRNITHVLFKIYINKNPCFSVFDLLVPAQNFKSMITHRKMYFLVKFSTLTIKAVRGFIGTFVKSP